MKQSQAPISGQKRDGAPETSRELQRWSQRPWWTKDRGPGERHWEAVGWAGIVLGKRLRSIATGGTCVYVYV